MMSTCDSCGAVVVRPMWVRWDSGYERWWESLCPECGAELEWDEYCDEWDMMHPAILREEEEEDG